ncbi:hypothetical protein VTH82DRAFT_2211 [Thermothelomyces myriococcoides]
MKYRNLGLGVFALGLPLAFGAIYTEGVQNRGIEVAYLDEGTVLGEAQQEVRWTQPGSHFTKTMRCNGGSKLTTSADRTWVGCCSPGKSLKGSPITGFYCCSSGEEVVGNDAVGYHCCLHSQEFDGQKCICPPGTTQSSDGSCQKSTAQCSSGITSGACYALKTETGEYISYNNRGWYSASKLSNSFQIGKFRFCKDESCTRGLPINPGDAVRIQDLHGEAISGKNPNHWLNGAQDGGRVAKTANYVNAGVFAITKWAPGKYCLSGLAGGVASTCPSDDPAMTFITQDSQSCLPVELFPVPCDIRDVNNNCLWPHHRPYCSGHTCLPDGINPSTYSPWTGIPPAATATMTLTRTMTTTTTATTTATATVLPPGLTGVINPCPPGQPWKDGRCYPSITDCADRAYPQYGDTSYKPADFPCSAGRERPCRGEEVKPWSVAKLPWGGSYQQPGPPKPYDIEVNYDFDIIMTIVDIEAQSEHFLIKLDGEFLGETGGENGYKNVYVGNYNDPEWCLLNGYTRGYFRIPRGKHTITIEWPQGTGKYKNEAGSPWWYGIAKYRFDKPCDPNKCLPTCAVQKQKAAEEARRRLGLPEAQTFEHTEL